MKRQIANASILLAWILAGCSRPGPEQALKIEVTPTAYLMNGIEYKSKAELTAALKALPAPTAIYLKQSPEAKPERFAEAVEAVKDTAATAQVLTVGNEVFR